MPHLLTSYFVAVVALLGIFLFSAPTSAQFTATLTVTDSASPNLHVHAPGSSFTLSITAVYGGSDSVFYQWLDAFGNALSSKFTLPSNTPTSIQPPDNLQGYISLTFTAGASIALPNRNPGEPYSYGFMRATPRGTTTNPNSYFGLVHSYNLQDPYVASFQKNSWWNSKYRLCFTFPPLFSQCYSYYCCSIFCFVLYKINLSFLSFRHFSIQLGTFDDVGRSIGKDRLLHVRSDERNHQSRQRSLDNHPGRHRGNIFIPAFQHPERRSTVSRKLCQRGSFRWSLHRARHRRESFREFLPAILLRQSQGEGSGSPSGCGECWGFQH